jgi:predicted site-specific integrase-resolvase
MKYERPRDLVRRLGVCNNTLRTWAKHGKLKYIKTPGGHLRCIVNEKQPEAPSKPRRQIVYCRVSSPKQKDDLERQEAMFKQSHPGHEIIKDIGSGLNFKRRGLLRLVDAVLQGSVAEIVVAHKDRLCRFAFDFIEWICKRGNTKLVVQDKEIRSAESELGEDLMAIVHVFSCRHNGMRRYKSSKDKDSAKCASSQGSKRLDAMCQDDVQPCAKSGEDH